MQRASPVCALNVCPQTRTRKCGSVQSRQITRRRPWFREHDCHPDAENRTRNETLEFIEKTEREKEGMARLSMTAESNQSITWSLKLAGVVMS